MFSKIKHPWCRSKRAEFYSITSILSFILGRELHGRKLRPNGDHLRRIWICFKTFTSENLRHTVPFCEWIIENCITDYCSISSHCFMEFGNRSRTHISMKQLQLSLISQKHCAERRKYIDSEEYLYLTDARYLKFRKHPFAFDVSSLIRIVTPILSMFARSTHSNALIFSKVSWKRSTHNTNVHAKYLKTSHSSSLNLAVARCHEKLGPGILLLP